MSDPYHPPSLPSSSSLPTKVRISSIAPLNPPTPSKSATLAFYGAPSRVRSGSVATYHSTTDSIGSRVTRPLYQQPNPSAGSVQGSQSLNAIANSVLSTPNSPSAAHSPPPSHVGGILPPASFFRPLQTRPSVNKPSSNLAYGRSPHSHTHGQSSISTLPGIPTKSRPPRIPESIPRTSEDRDHSLEDPVMHLDPLSRQFSHKSNFSSPSMIDSTLRSASLFDSSVGTSSLRGLPVKGKTSREMLLPIREPLAPSKSGGAVGKTMRGSLDKIFGRTSIDSSQNHVDLEKAEGHNVNDDKVTSPQFIGPSVSIPVPRQDTGSDIGLPSSTLALSTARSPRVFITPRSPTSPTATRTPLPPPVPTPHHRNFGLVPALERPTTPIVSEKTGRPLRNYQLHPARNTFFMGGRLLMGGDSPLPFLGTLTLVFSIAGLWFGSVAPWYWHHVSIALPIVAAYMTLLTISSLLMTAFRDPGIIPRNLDPAPPFTAESPTSDLPRQPLPRDLRVRGGTVRVKWCPTCKTYRPPRSSHCKICDNCVDGCDHHCQWVNNCVGRRNYTHFLTFLITAMITITFIIVTSALQLVLMTHRDHTSFRHSLSKSPASAVAFLLSILAVWPLLVLFAYHLRLVVLNVTTVEQVRNQAHASIIPGSTPPNPFTFGNWRRNIAYTFCRPAGYTWIQASEVAVKDERKINPGVEQEWKREMKEAREGVSGNGDRRISGVSLEETDER